MIVKVGGTEVDIRVEAILSMPRLSFTANHFAWAQALMPLGIRPTMGTGAFWSQVNTRVMEQFIDKAEYLLAIDYDTFFTKEDVEQLFAMAMTFQCDAITGLQEVDTAHFGCTVISTAALKRMKKPWFWSKPGPDGSWNDGRIDDDIWFWRNWRDSGNRVFVSPRVVLGHGEYVVTWPGKDLGVPVFQWTTEFTNTNKRPESAWSVGQS